MTRRPRARPGDLWSLGEHRLLVHRIPLTSIMELVGEVQPVRRRVLSASEADAIWDAASAEHEPHAGWHNLD